MATPGGDTAPAARGAGEHPACDLYLPGHLVHVIQERKFWESDDPVRWGRFEAVDDGCLVVRFLDGTGRYRVHRPAEVARVTEMGDKVRVSERWHVAVISRRFEQLLAVCIALPDDPWRPCSVAPKEQASLEELDAHLAERGGFMVSGRQVARLAGIGPDRLDEPPPEGARHEVS